MYLDEPTLRELTRFVERMFVSNEKREPSYKKSVTGFFHAWTGTVGAKISVQNTGSNTTSERVVINRFANDIASIANEFEQAISRAEATQQILRSRDRAQQATGDTGAAVLGGHYAKIAEDESFTAMAWTGVSIGSLVGVVTIGIWVLARSVDVPIGDRWIETLFHLALTLPVIGIAAFSARLARHHRLLARWAKTAAVQINSIGAFAEQMPTKEGREQLILHLGQTVFGPPVFADESKTENVSGIPPGLIELLKEVVKRDSPK